MATGVRLDQWLWAARFFKTRSLAAAAAQGGKIHVRGDRAKPARARPRRRPACRSGVGPYEWVVTVNESVDETRPPPRKPLCSTKKQRKACASAKPRALRCQAQAALFRERWRPSHQEGPPGSGTFRA